ncbi:MAG: hypothetical protein RLP44_14970 [Aggregatilineales bacterium]
MPITEMYFNDGILFVREQGRIEKQDAKRFAEQILHCASKHSGPIAAVIDALEVNYISTDARKIFVRASTLPNFSFSAVAARDAITAQTARVIGSMSQDGHTYIFPTLEDAWDYALSRIKSARV